MSGRRILDAVAILKAARTVASNHTRLRRQEFDAFKNTSSLINAFREGVHQAGTDIRNATVVARPNGGSEARNPIETTTSERDIKETPTTTAKNEDLEQEHLYGISKDETAVAPIPSKELQLKGERDKRKPLPDGTIPSTRHPTIISDAEADMSPDVRRNVPFKKHIAETVNIASGPNGLGRSTSPGPIEYATRSSFYSVQGSQHQSVQQATSRLPEPSPDDPLVLEAASGEDELCVDQEKDVYHKPHSQASPVYSSLPRVKVPRNTENSQDDDKYTHGKGINQDVYYTTPQDTTCDALPETQSIPQQETIPEELYSEIFHSPRVAKLLTRENRRDRSREDLHIQGPERSHPQQRKAAKVTDQESQYERIPGNISVKTSGQAGMADSETLQLASDTAEATIGPPANASKTPTSINQASSKSIHQMHESKVPSSRLGRLWQYGGLATSMAFGAVGESLRRATGSRDGNQGPLILNESNTKRLVAKLSRMRGAALKLGQMMSFQDSKMLPAPILAVLQRVQDSADYMPASQRNKVLANNLGSNWRDLFSSFDEIPIAAASIGQVHGAVLKGTGQRLAVKVQYPGVSESIDSDLNNLSILLTASRLLPKGLYLDKTIANARTELAWECDYTREAEAAKRFKTLLSDDQDSFLVPSIISEASGPQVLTMERMEGVGVTKVIRVSQEEKDWIGTQILRLCLREITEFKYMQTDPNWTNFLYNSKTKKLELLDFGASREFADTFIQPYIQTLLAASQHDRDRCRELSIQLGYLTGHESRTMIDAHVDSVLTLAEPFMDSSPEIYDFHDQTITDRIRGLIPVMIKERLAPPPEETYSLHRKLSGAFLLCARLGSRVSCKELFAKAMERANIK